MQMKLFVQRLDPRAPLPAYQTPGSAAMDLAALLDAPVTIAPRALVNIPPGLAIALPDAGGVARVFDRVAQLRVVPVARACVLELDELPATQRGAGGFGSTGK